MFRRFVESWAGLLFCLLAWASVATAQVPPVSWALATEDQVLAAPEGHVWLQWAPDSDQPVDGYLVERTSPGEDPAVRRIADASTFIAGLPEGRTEVRVRAVRGSVEGPWSDKLNIEVSYPSLRLVRILGVLGTLLLVATVALIISGHRRLERSASPASGKGDDG